ncbi:MULTISPECIES: AfsR/SARP family transcriptional regulator [unclassified Micromonospora]|uniref:AfsR/SARP family transcriptional regulator n=1 Tax=unclassified Micromonospora TaxID=2617518 RepID=UPI003A893DCC
MDLVVDNRSLDIGGFRQRIVLATLGLNVNRVVSVDQLIDAVWGSSPPATARGQIQICVSALRKLLMGAGYPDVIGTRRPGYILRIADLEIDVVEFSSLVGEAQERAEAGRLEEAASTLREALALWRGPALSGISSDLLARNATVLEEQRISAIEERIRLDLALGRHREMASELSALVVEYPLRERFHALLMLALYRAGRQAEALEVARRARTVLLEEVGIDPGQELQDLERAILQHDPQLGSSGNAPSAIPQPLAAVTSPGGGDDLSAERHASVMERAGAGRPVVEAAPVKTVEAAPSAAQLIYGGVIPRQLPASIADFTGREEHLRLIKRLLGDDPDSDEARWGVQIVVASGKGGVGKSSLAARAAHELSDRYPDGQLYADIGSWSGEDRSAGLLARFLRALGVAGSAVPEDVEERGELYRSKLFGRRVLLLLDDVTSEAQVPPLLPGSPTCAVIITSRFRLSGLSGAHQIDVEVFETDNSVKLLTRIIGQDRAAAEPRALLDLVKFCGGLPLALRITGARLASRPHWRLDDLVERLHDEARRLDEFAHHGLELRSNIGLSYQILAPPAQRLFRLTSLVRAPDFPGWTAAALLDSTFIEANDVLESLVDAQLVDTVRYPDGVPRYRMHDVIRIFAGEQLAQEETEAERKAALTRLLGAWMALAEEAHRREYGGDYTILHGAGPRWHPRPGEADRRIRDLGQWWETERRALVTAVRQAAAAGLDELCWDLALTSVALFEAKGYFDDWQASAEVALAAAEAARNRIGVAAMHYSLGTLNMVQARLTEAERWFTTAARIFQDEGHQHGYALVLRNAAHVDGLRGESASMLTKYDAALRIMREVGDRIGEAHIMRNLAKSRIDAGDNPAAIEMLDEALAICRETGCLRVEAQVMYRFAEAYVAIDEVDQAREALHRTLRIVRDTGDRIGEAHALYGLGLLRHREGRLDKAHATLAHTLDLARTLREQSIEAKALRALRELDRARGDVQTSEPHPPEAAILFGS